MKRISTTVSLALLACLATAHAQDEAKPAAAPKPEARPRVKGIVDRDRDYNLDPIKTFYMRAGTSPNDANEILTGLRLMLDPSVKVYLSVNANAIIIRDTPEILAQAQQIIDALDRPRKVYKLTYTIVESEAGKRLGVQHFSVSMVTNARTTLKNGSKVPVATGSYTAGAAGTGSQTQFTYLDVGLNFDSTLQEGANGLTLKSKVEQSSAAEEKQIGGIVEPVIRQTVLEGTSMLTTGKPVMLGSLDIAGSTRHLDVEVLLEPAN